jgi:hypothetical protein
MWPRLRWPHKCRQSYRLISVRKEIGIEPGQQHLFDQIRYLFYITNVRGELLTASEVVFDANERCNQENPNEQLKNGLKALRVPSGGLVSNRAYAVIATLAWNLSIWLSILLPKRLARDVRRMEYRRFSTA